MMNAVELGHSGIEVSRMCLGCLYFGARDSKETSFKRLDQYTAAGGNFLDTANMYSHWLPGNNKGGESELLIGEWLKQRAGRLELVIASKVGFPYPGVAYGATAKQVRDECEKSLKRLQIDCIDLYYAHSDDLNTPMEETLGALNDLIVAGKVRAIGASNFKAWRLERARQLSLQNGLAEYCCVQQRYSYLRPKAGADFGGQIAANEDLLEYVQDTGITLLAYSPLLSGAYTNRSKAFEPQYIGPDSQARMAALEQVAGETGATANQLVYYWLMNSAPAAIPLVASTTDEQFAEAVNTLKLSLTQAQLRTLTTAGY